MISTMQQHVHGASTKVADIAAATSVGGAGVSFLSDFNTYVQIGAGLVAIIAGLAAAAFHLFKLYWAHKDRQSGK
jgi:hypothetical protein